MHNVLRVVAPFDWEFIAEMRRLNGRWDHQAWLIPIDKADQVPGACMRCFGTDGRIVDQADAHIFTSAGAVIEAPANERVLFIGKFALGRLAGYRAVLADEVEVLSGELCRRKEKVSDHRIRYVAPTDREGHIVFRNASRTRAERLVEQFVNGPVDGQLAVVTRTLVKPCLAIVQTDPQDGK